MHICGLTLETTNNRTVTINEPYPVALRLGHTPALVAVRGAGACRTQLLLYNEAYPVALRLGHAPALVTLRGAGACRTQLLLYNEAYPCAYDLRHAPALVTGRRRGRRRWLPCAERLGTTTGPLCVRPVCGSNSNWRAPASSACRPVDAWCATPR